MGRVIGSLAALVVAAALSGCGPTWDHRLPEPFQGPVLTDGPALDAARRIHQLATFSADVLVLRRQDYPRDPKADPISEFVPTDFVMAWGTAGLREGRIGVSLAQGNRWYSWQVPRAAWFHHPLVRRFSLETANWHLVPATPEVAAEIAAIRVGDVVDVEGDLVTIALADGETARSSTRRDDTGDGACEIVRVTSARVVGR